ncbi:MAG TPA: hypothetical protein VND64_05445 [Pirellulales bacterium]|nr:hypothetical protein [Pirellulales bacterium]
MRDILAWADAHHARTGRWPEPTTGRILDALDETWNAVQSALAQGYRGMPAGSSLARLLSQFRGVRNLHGLPPLSINQILDWADAFHAGGGDWPKATSGKIPDSNGETWAGINCALHAGTRGLEGGTRLVRLLAEHRGKRNHLALPRLTTKQILAWADAHRKRTGRWPRVLTGAVADAPSETWLGINTALMAGNRGLPGGSSIALLLAKHRGVPHRRKLPPLSVPRVLAWADDYLRRTGRFPTRQSGAVDGSGGETWRTIDKALRNGARGLPTTSLPKLLARRRGRGRMVRGRLLGRLRLVRWIKAHHLLFDKWPTTRSGAVAGIEGETWFNINMSLRYGYRGLPGGETLRDLVQSTARKSRGSSNRRNAGD